ncbi:MAG: flagellar basal body rod C-terminal domain-containing protein [Nocardioidaceae bacterium]|nr:flagellar basal body rod C-terminal domain-containing protein [Nocardioidaceae bacterium]
MSAFSELNIAGSGLTMHQRWLDNLSDNIANVNTVRGTDQAAFQARFTSARAVAGGGVVVGPESLGDPVGRVTYSPDHPLADAEGYVRMPDIDMASQMSQLVIAQRGFQAQATVVKNAQDTYASALSIGRGA